MKKQANVTDQQLYDFYNPNLALKIKDWLKIFVIVFVVISGLFYVLKWSIVEQVVFKGNSMFPTIKEGDKKNFIKQNLIIKNKDIVLVNIEGVEYISRIIATPNQKVLINNQKLYINTTDGKSMEQIEEYTSKDGNQKPLPTCAQPNCSYEYDEVLLKDDEYYLLGDNRPFSYDSRVFGPIKKSDIKSIMI
jgi:signal peptidase I